MPPLEATRAIFRGLTPPEVDASGWLLTFDYRKSGAESGLIGSNGGGTKVNYVGPPDGLTLPLWVYEIYEFRVDPPVK